MNAFSTRLLIFPTHQPSHSFAIWLVCSDHGMTNHRTGISHPRSTYWAEASHLYIGPWCTDIKEQDSGAVSNNVGLNGRFAVLFLPVLFVVIWLHDFVQSLVKEYQALGSNAFWSTYSNNGVSLPISKVLDRMKISRMQKDVMIAEIAKRRYGDKFAEHFSYRVPGSSARRLLVRPNAIARRFRSLLGSSVISTSEQRASE